MDDVSKMIGDTYDKHKYDYLHAESVLTWTRSASCTCRLCAKFDRIKKEFPNWSDSDVEEFIKLYER